MTKEGIPLEEATQKVLSIEAEREYQADLRGHSPNPGRRAASNPLSLPEGTKAEPKRGNSALNVFRRKKSEGTDTEATKKNRLSGIFKGKRRSDAKIDFGDDAADVPPVPKPVEPAKPKAGAELKFLMLKRASLIGWEIGLKPVPVPTSLVADV